MHISDPGDQEMPRGAQPASPYDLGDMLNGVAYLTPDITAAEVAAGIVPDRLSNAVLIGDGHYVYNDLSPHQLTSSDVGLGRMEVIADIDELRDRAQYDQLTLGSELSARTVGSVGDLMDQALTDPYFLPVVRRHEWVFPDGGMAGDHTYHESVGVSYYSQNVSPDEPLPEASFGIGVTNPERETMTVAEAWEWTERLKQARRDRGQLGDSAA